MFAKFEKILCILLICVTLIALALIARDTILKAVDMIRLAPLNIRLDIMQ